VLAVHDLELRVGARVLMEDVSFRVSPGDKIGLVGRNGAGKTTLTKSSPARASPRADASTAPARSATSRRTRAPATRRT
jgi:ATPase subunit of ABC transporter with duplicated ATPase domains